MLDTEHIRDSSFLEFVLVLEDLEQDVQNAFLRAEAK